MAGVITTPPPAMHGAPHGVVAGAARTTHGSFDHGDAHLQRELPVASFLTPPPLPANGQLDSQSPLPALSPFTHVSQLFAGLGQAHPSIDLD